MFFCELVHNHNFSLNQQFDLLSHCVFFPLLVALKNALKIQLIIS